MKCFLFHKYDGCHCVRCGRLKKDAEHKWVKMEGKCFEECTQCGHKRTVPHTVENGICTVCSAQCVSMKTFTPEDRALMKAAVNATLLLLDKAADDDVRMMYLVAMDALEQNSDWMGRVEFMTVASSTLNYLQYIPEYVKEEDRQFQQAIFAALAQKENDAIDESDRLLGITHDEE